MKDAAIDHELHVCMGDSWELIAAKLKENEKYVDARMEALAARIAELERGLDHLERNWERGR